MNEIRRLHDILLPFDWPIRLKSLRSSNVIRGRPFLVRTVSNVVANPFRDKKKAPEMSSTTRHCSSGFFADSTFGGTAKLLGLFDDSVDLG